MNKNSISARRARWLKMKTKKKMSLRAIGKLEGVSSAYVAKIIGNTGLVRPVDEHLAAVYEFIKGFAAAQGFPPSNQDIADAFPSIKSNKPSSLSVVAYWLRKLEDAGKIERTAGIARGLKAL